jgi:hypothetical protein
VLVPVSTGPSRHQERYQFAPVNLQDDMLGEDGIPVASLEEMKTVRIKFRDQEYDVSEDMTQDVDDGNEDEEGGPEISAARASLLVEVCQQNDDHFDDDGGDGDEPDSPPPSYGDESDEVPEDGAGPGAATATATASERLSRLQTMLLGDDTYQHLSPQQAPTDEPMSYEEFAMSCNIEDLEFDPDDSSDGEEGSIVDAAPDELDDENLIEYSVMIADMQAVLHSSVCRSARREEPGTEALRSGEGGGYEGEPPGEGLDDDDDETFEESSFGYDDEDDYLDDIDGGFVGGPSVGNEGIGEIDGTARAVIDDVGQSDEVAAVLRSIALDFEASGGFGSDNDEDDGNYDNDADVYDASDGAGEGGDEDEDDEYAELDPDESLIKTSAPTVRKYVPKASRDEPREYLDEPSAATVRSAWRDDSLCATNSAADFSSPPRTGPIDSHDPATESERIHEFLSSKIGADRLNRALRLLENIDSVDDEDEDGVLVELEKIVGPNNLQYLDDMYRLLVQDFS